MGVAARANRLFGALLFLLSPLVTTEGCGPAPTPSPDTTLVTRAYPPGGTYPISRLPTIRLVANRDALIYFTLDGTIPDLQKADPLRGPTFVARSPVSGIPILNTPQGMELKFFAVDLEGRTESLKTERYFVDGPPVASITPPCGNLYNKNITAVISTNEPATIFYTLDGSEPGPDNPNAVSGPSPLGPISIERSLEVRFRAVDAIGNWEPEVHRCSYTLDKIPPSSRANPAGGNYTAPLNVTLEITNDSGIIYYTTNGAVPRVNDPQGHTQIASIQTRLTLSESTFLRFFAVDKAGNLEMPEGTYHEEVYVLNNEIPVIATPPGGSYSETTMTVELKAYPPGATISYSLNGSPFTAYTSPVLLNTRDAELRFFAVFGAQMSPLHTERYELGVGGTSLLFTEEFTRTTFIDTTKTTALVDLSQGKVMLPRIAPVPSSPLIHSTPQPAPLFQAGIRLDPLQPGVLGIADGVFNPLQPGSGADAAGTKFYSFDNASTQPSLLFQGMVGASGSLPQYLGLELLRSFSGNLPLAVLIPATSIFPLAAQRLDFYELTTLSSPQFRTSLPVTTFTSTSQNPPLILSRKLGDGTLFVQERSPSQKLSLYQVSGTSATLSVTKSGELPLPAEGAGIALDPQDPNQGFIFLRNCTILAYRVNLDLTLTQENSTNVCAGNNDLPSGLTSVRVNSVLYLVGVYAGLNGAQVVVVRYPDATTRYNALPPGYNPQGIVYTPLVFFASSNPVLALPAQGGEGVFFYDLNDLPGLFSGAVQSLSYIQRFSPPLNAGGGVQWDPNPLAAGDEVLFLKLYANPSSGGVMAVRVPANLREEVNEAWLYSKNVNPDPQRSFLGLKYLSNAIQGNVSFEVSFDGVSWTPFNCCSSLFVDPPRTTLFYRARLVKGTPSPILDSLTFRFDYP